jgi:hypothetical protein
MRWIVALAFAISTSCAPQQAIHVKTTDGKVDTVAKRRTYALATAASAPSGYKPGELTAAVLDQMLAAVDREMQKKGYARSDEKGELTVRVSAGSRTVTDSPGGTARFGASVQQNVERGVVVDILDPTSGEVLFHGYARYDADPGTVDLNKVYAAVTQILAGVPTPEAR